MAILKRIDKSLLLFDVRLCSYSANLCPLGRRRKNCALSEKFYISLTCLFVSGRIIWLALVGVLCAWETTPVYIVWAHYTHTHMYMCCMWVSLSLSLSARAARAFQCASVCVCVCVLCTLPTGIAEGPPSLPLLQQLAVEPGGAASGEWRGGGVESSSNTRKAGQGLLNPSFHQKPFLGHWLRTGPAPAELCSVYIYIVCSIYIYIYIHIYTHTHADYAR